MAPSWPAPGNNGPCSIRPCVPHAGGGMQRGPASFPHPTASWGCGSCSCRVMNRPISPCPRGGPSPQEELLFPPLLPSLVSCAPYLAPCPVPALAWGYRTSPRAGHLPVPGTHWALPSFSSCGHLQPFLGAGPVCDPQCHPRVPSLSKQTLKCFVLQWGQASTHGPIPLAQQAAQSPGEVSEKLL